MLITAQWRPAPLWVAVQLLTGALLLAITPLVASPGAVLLVPTGLAALAFGARDLVLGPALAADATGITVVEGVRRTSAPWSEVARLRVVTDRRAHLLELDLSDRLVVLSQRRLDAPPDEVLAALEQLRSAASS